MDLIYALLVNIVLVGILGGLAVWITNYNLAWWLRNQRSNYLMKNWFGKWVFLEIKLPKEIHKNPSAMEIAFNGLYQKLGLENKPVNGGRQTTGGGHGGKAKKEPFWKWRDRTRENFFRKYVSGSMRLWSSLEIVSEEGQIKFYVVTPAKNAEIFKSYTYSQFPGIEIVETEDFALKYQYKNLNDTPLYVGRYNLGGVEKDYLPIKTYVDYGLDRDPKEEYKIDPLTPLLEAMAAAGPGETYWYQVLIRPTIYEEDWKKETHARVDQILGIKRADKDDPEKHIHKGDIISQARQVISILPHEKNEIEIIQRNIEKYGWDTIIRMFYIVDNKKTKFNLNKGVFTVVNAMKSFNKPGFNGFGFKTLTLDTDYPFRDPTGLRSEGTRGWIWRLAKLRVGFYHELPGLEGNWHAFKAIWHHWVVGKSWEWAMGQWGEIKEYYTMPGELPHRGDADDFILNSEELATIWHFPGKSFNNTSSRVESVKSDPPRNLPI